MILEGLTGYIMLYRRTQQVAKRFVNTSSQISHGHHQIVHVLVSRQILGSIAIYPIISWSKYYIFLTVIELPSVMFCLLMLYIICKHWGERWLHTFIVWNTRSAFVTCVHICGKDNLFLVCTDTTTDFGNRHKLRSCCYSTESIVNTLVCSLKITTRSNTTTTAAIAVWKPLLSVLLLALF